MYTRSVPAKSNVRFVERAKRVIEEYGKQAATPDEARELLNLNIQVYLFSMENYWFTPMYFSDVWQTRRMIHRFIDLFEKEDK